MSEQNVEGHEEKASLATEPNSDVTSQEASTTETIRKELDELKDLFRGFQSKADKDASAIEKRLMGKFEQVAGKLGVNLSPEQKMNLRVMELEEQLASVGQGNANSQPQTVKEPQQTPVDMVKIKQAYSDIDFNDPQVLKAVAENLTNEEGLLLALGKIKVGSTARPQATAASVTSPAGRVKASVTMEDLQAEYNRLLNDPVTFKKPENKQRRAEIIKLMEEKENA